jgi:hypothetical protein
MPLSASHSVRRFEAPAERVSKVARGDQSAFPFDNETNGSCAEKNKAATRFKN